MRWELMCLLAHHVVLCRATVGTVARRKKLAPPMGWVTRLGAKRPANVARFRGGTASQRCRSKRSRCATPPKLLKNRMCGITSKKPRESPSTLTGRELCKGADGPDTLYCSSLSSAESSCSSAASKLRPSPSAVTLRLFVGDLARRQAEWSECASGVTSLAPLSPLLLLGACIYKSS